MSELMASLHQTHPCRRFHRAIPGDLQTWGGRRAIFAELVERTRPRLVIEVGSWKGGSAITMGTQLKRMDLGGQVLCVDTWLGSVEHWYAKDDPERRSYHDSLRLRHGYPHLFDQFLVNVINAGLEDVIVPFPATSAVAAEWLRWKGVRAELIYLDAGHGEDDVHADLTAYFPLLADGGVIFGDDWQWSGVARAVTRFAEARGLTHDVVEDGAMWRLNPT